MTTATTALTACALKALRTADTVAFRTEGDTHQIVCTKRAAHTNNSPWEHEAQYYEIPTQGVNAESAFFCLLYAKYAPQWLTIASLLKVGDVLSLRWEPDYGTTERLQQHSLHTDQLTLVVCREKKRLEFVVGYSTGLDDSGRMIRRRSR